MKRVLSIVVSVVIAGGAWVSAAQSPPQAPQAPPVPIVIGPPAPVPPEVAIPRPTPEELALVNDAVLMIGTNNNAGNTAPEIAEGIGAVVLELLSPQRARGSHPRQDRGSESHHRQRLIKPVMSGKRPT